MRHLAWTMAFAVAAGASAPASAQSISIVAAENFYGEAAAAVGGDRVTVTSIIDSPGADPHEFEPTPSVARSVADARIVIYNGVDYDAWMDRLIAASKRRDRIVINVGTLLGRNAGDNPHLWYDPVAMPAMVDALTKALSAADPAAASGYAARAAAYKRSLAPIAAKIAEVKKKFAGEPVTATEPVFGYMARALGLTMRNEGFQTAVMNDTEPSARDTAGMERDLKTGQIKVFFYNSQVTDPTTEHLLQLARSASIPVVGVTETEPEGTTYIDWMLSEIDAAEKALAGPSS